MGGAALHGRRHGWRWDTPAGEGRRPTGHRSPAYASPSKVVRKAGRAASAVLALILLQGAAAAQDEAAGGGGAIQGAAVGKGESLAVVGAVVGGGNDVQARISGTMPAPTRDKLTTAFGTAVERVQEVAECRALFTELGADPMRILATGIYYAADPYRETTSCRSALAITYVGAVPTWLCRRFGFLSDDEAAVVVIHEALHHGGLTERPSDPRGMSPGAINAMVRRACGFARE